MIVLPTGTFTMGKAGIAKASPERTVSIDYNIAVSKFEITFVDYEKYTSNTGKTVPDDNGWGRASRPVINVSWQDANNYADWLSRQTGKTYRLPTEAEWEYFARAGKQSDYWWNDDDARERANCKRGCDSEFAGMFSGKSAPVGSYAKSPFGLFDTAGNVSEWTQDCYQNHYLGAPRDGSTRNITASACKERVTRGGSAKDNYKDLYTFAREGANPDTRSETIGFRVVQELGY
jgi:serine/threonine-protein kinase PpkA